MVDKLSNEDLELLKGYFRKRFPILSTNFQKIIEEHKNSPISVLELFVEQPKTHRSFLNPLVVGLILAAFVLLANSDSPTQFSADFLSFVIYLGVSFCLGGFVSLFLGKIEAEDARWLLFKFMIALKKGGKEADDVREFIKNQKKI